jgi:hypothetical protein
MTAEMQAVERFKKLAQLALSEDEDGESTEEARNAAVKAIELLADDDGELIVLPKSELADLQQKVEGAQQSLARVKEAQTKGMMMGGILGFLLGKGGLGR